MVRRTKKKRGGMMALAKYASTTKDSDELAYPNTTKFLLTLNPLQWFYWIIFQQGAKAVANFKLFRRILKSYKISKNQYAVQYAELSEPQKKDFLYAAMLIKTHYNKRVGDTFEVLKPAQDIIYSCDDIESLDIQYRLMKSTNYKGPSDFNKVFKTNTPGKFENLFNNKVSIAKQKVKDEQKETEEKIKKEQKKSYFMRKTSKLQKDTQKLETETIQLDKSISMYRIQPIIEELFKVTDAEGKEYNYSYMIAFILNDIYPQPNAHSYITDKSPANNTPPIISMKDKLDNTIFAHEKHCKSVYSLWRTVQERFLKPASSTSEAPVGDKPEEKNEEKKEEKLSPAQEKIKKKQWVGDHDSLLDIRARAQRGPDKVKAVLWGKKLRIATLDEITRLCSQCKTFITIDEAIEYLKQNKTEYSRWDINDER